MNVDHAATERFRRVARAVMDAKADGSLSAHYLAVFFGADPSEIGLSHDGCGICAAKE